MIYLFIVALPRTAFSQGCSDAGMCTIGSLDNSQIAKEPYSSFTISNVSGFTGEDGSFIYINSIIFSAQLKVSTRSFINVRLPFQMAFGDLGSTQNFGDLTVSYNSNLLPNSRNQLMLTLGASISTNNADLREDELPLPMIYQSSLGTYDMILGASYFVDKWHLAIGYQHPFNRNNNGFLRSVWPQESNASNYFESNQFKRGDDLMVRIQKGFTKGKRTIFVGAMPILRLQKDEIKKNGNIVRLEGSDELTLNLNFGYLYRMSEKSNLRFTLAGPMIWRESRADGLTRFVVISASIEFM